MPVFIVLVFSYLYLTFKTYYIQPWATTLCFVAQLGAAGVPIGQDMRRHPCLEVVTSNARRRRST